MCAQSGCFSYVRLFVTPWTAAHQAPLSMVVLQTRILEWVAMPSSLGSSRPRDGNQVAMHLQATLQVGPLPTKSPGKPV